MVVVRLHVLQFPVLQPLVNCPHVLRWSAYIRNYANKLLFLLWLQNVGGQRHVVFVTSASWGLQPDLLAYVQVLHILTASWVVVHSKQSLQNVLVVHDIQDVSNLQMLLECTT